MVRLTAPRARLMEKEAPGTVTLAAAGTAWDFAEQAAPMLRTLLSGEPTTLGALADVTGLEVKDVASAVSVLIDGQAASVVRAAL
jgi:hypothetical protein